MKVLLINGSPNEFGCTYTALKEVADTLAKLGVASDIVYLGKQPIAGCIACGGCHKTKPLRTSETYGNCDAEIRAV